TMARRALSTRELRTARRAGADRLRQRLLIEQRLSSGVHCGEACDRLVRGFVELEVVACVGLQVREMHAVLSRVLEVAAGVEQVAAIRPVVNGVAGGYVRRPGDHRCGVVQVLNRRIARKADGTEVR